MPQDEAIAIFRAAYDAGINWIDTAPVYGLGGSETLVGRFLSDVSNGDRPYVCTKCGVDWELDSDGVRTTRSLRPSLIRKQCESSLRRLRLEAIDVYLCHWPDEKSSLDAAWETMTALVTEGKVRAIGVSNFSARDLARCAQIGTIDAVQSRFSLLDRAELSDALGWAHRQGVSTMAYGVLNSGLMSGLGPRPSDWTRGKPSPADRELIQDLLPLARDAGLSLPGLVIAWALAWPEIDTAVVGASRPTHLQDAAAGAAAILDDALMAAVDLTLRRRRIGIGRTLPSAL